MFVKMDYIFSSPEIKVPIMNYYMFITTVMPLETSEKLHHRKNNYFVRVPAN